MDDCLFCKIVKGDIPCKKVYEDENVLAFHDISPQAPAHVLLIPKTHVKSLNEAQGEKAELLGPLMAAVPKVAAQLGLKNGYRAVINTGEDGNQTVAHLHVHVIGGRRMGWPPG